MNNESNKKHKEKGNGSVTEGHRDKKTATDNQWGK